MRFFSACRRKRRFSRDPGAAGKLVHPFRTCARANSYWLLCQPLAVAGSAPITGSAAWHCGWQQMLILEGDFAVHLAAALVVFFILATIRATQNGFPPGNEIISKSILKNEADNLGAAAKNLLAQKIVASFDPRHGCAFIFCNNCAVYGCMTFLQMG